MFPRYSGSLARLEVKHLLVKTIGRAEIHWLVRLFAQDRGVAQITSARWVRFSLIQDFVVFHDFGETLPGGVAKAYYHGEETGVSSSLCLKPH